ncbi:TetR/AcrR family transcriptional regulator [Streptomyces cinereospinus]|uniref:TetR/AcrR family transcriptional regulator n=1 Tax=Streptomyces cinereospinus TaxID=285561 RepID=A0ABV5N7G9_9ACTN
MSKASTRDRLAQAAFALFDERGYEQTTIDDVAERAGVGRTTFFRHYRSKEEVIFPDHDRLLAAIRDRLDGSTHATALVAVSDAVRLVLMHYLDEGDLAQRRYALTSKVPALREREIVSVARYQRLFREFISDWMGDTGQPASLRAELMAANVVAAHNHVLRRWLRGESADPVSEVDDAMREVLALFPMPPVAPAATVAAAPSSQSGAEGGTTVVVLRSDADIDALLPSLRDLLRDGAGS